MDAVRSRRYLAALGIPVWRLRTPGWPDAAGAAVARAETSAETSALVAGADDGAPAVIAAARAPRLTANVAPDRPVVAGGSPLAAARAALEAAQEQATGRDPSGAHPLAAPIPSPPARPAGPVTPAPVTATPVTATPVSAAARAAGRPNSAPSSTPTSEPASPPAAQPRAPTPPRRSLPEDLEPPPWIDEPPPEEPGDWISVAADDADPASNPGGGWPTDLDGAAPARPAPDPVAGMDWDALARTVAGCRGCGLCERRTNTVFGVGNREAALMLIGEGPGQEEDLRGEPFVGRAGQLLDRMLAAVGLGREHVYIANVVKCRPPGNRNPTAEEAAACRAYLARQIALVAPRLLVSLGGVAATALLGQTAPVGQLRGQLHRYQPDDGGPATPLIVTYHPSYYLRSPAEKARGWQDLQRIVKQLASG